MAVTVTERYRGVSGDSSSRRIDYVVRGAADDIEAIDETRAQAPSTYDGLPRSNVEVEELADHLGLYQTSVTYALPGQQEKGNQETDDVDYSFELGLTTKRIYRSYSTRSTALNSNIAANTHKENHQLIGIADDGMPEGTDVRVPVSGFQLTWFAPAAQLTESYRIAVHGLVGKVNSLPFWGFPTGTILFTGASGRLRSSADWELTYRFEYQPNISNKVIGVAPNTITISSAYGWDEIWVRYVNGKDAEKRTVKIPAEAYVEQIYEFADLNNLNIAYQMLSQLNEPLEIQPGS